MWLELRNGNLVKKSIGTAKTCSKRSVNQTEFLMHVQQVPRGQSFAHYQSLVSHDEQFGKILAFIFYSVVFLAPGADIAQPAVSRSVVDLGVLCQGCLI